MSKRRRKKGVLVIIGILIIACLVLYLILFRFGDQSSKVVDEIKKFGYTLEDRDNDLMQEKFNLLKDVLAEDEIDYLDYAEYLSELFIIDLYTLDNKLNKYDVGGCEFIHPDHQANYKLKVEDTLYRYLEENSQRKQKLSEVVDIDAGEINKDSFTFGEVEYDSYVAELSWGYQKDLGYDNKGTVTLIRIDDKLYVAEYTAEVSEWKE